jgi:hypothetical protein
VTQPLPERPQTPKVLGLSYNWWRVLAAWQLGRLGTTFVDGPGAWFVAGCLVYGVAFAVIRPVVGRADAHDRMADVLQRFADWRKKP